MQFVRDLWTAEGHQNRLRSCMDVPMEYHKWSVCSRESCWNLAAENGIEKNQNLRG